MSKQIEYETRAWAGRVVIGVHIRRTDNVWARENSPIELFVTAMDKELAKHPNVCFFVASDDIETKQCLASRYADCVMFRKDVKRREDRGGCEDALIDLLLLSKTSKILGSCGSSFSVVAASIGLCELYVLQVNPSDKSHDERGCLI